MHVIAPPSVWLVEEEVLPACSGPSVADVVELADRVRRQRDRQDEVGERLHLAGVSCVPRPSRPTNAGLNALNARSSSSGSWPVVEPGAVAAPVHRPRARHAAQASASSSGPFSGWNSQFGHGDAHAGATAADAQPTASRGRDCRSARPRRTDRPGPTPGCRSRRRCGSSRTRSRRGPTCCARRRGTAARRARRPAPGRSAAARRRSRRPSPGCSRCSRSRCRA